MQSTDLNTTCLFKKRLWSTLDDVSSQRTTFCTISCYGKRTVILSCNGERGELSGKSAGLVIKRSRVRVPAGAAGEFSSPGSTFCADSYFGIRVTAVARKRSRSFCQKCRWQVTAKHIYTLPMWLWMKWHCNLVRGWMVYTELAPKRQHFTWH